MIEADKRLKNILDQKNLIATLAKTRFPFALWRLPQTSTRHLIISLSGTERENMLLEDSNSGFLVNAFQDQHPSNPYFISADIVITQEKEVKINPKIGAQQLDAFVDEMIGAEEEKSLTVKDYPSVNHDHDKDRASFTSSVEQAIEEIKKGTFEKVVLSRYKKVDLPNDFCFDSFFDRICEAYINAFCSVVSIPEKGIWIGATPETLLSNTKNHFKTVALAGTKVLSPDQTLAEIAWTQKEIEEQALVSRYIINCFKKIRLREFHEHGPKTVKAGNLAHLKTTFEVDFGEVDFNGLADQMLELLHPTSAVCGMPLKEARAFIETTEHYDREFYAGFLGPVNYEGITHLFVNLRCLKIEEHYAKLFAGAGITEDSNPAKEFEETQSKMNIMYSMLNH